MAFLSNHTVQLHEEVGKEKIKLENIPRAACLPACSASHMPCGNQAWKTMVWLAVTVPGLP